MLSSLRVRLPDLTWVTVQTRVSERPILGLCDAVFLSDQSEPITYFRSVQWSCPECIPPLEKPGLLPAGAGTAILNALSWFVQLAGVPSLRYIGPYPTGALFDSLFTCFEVVGEPAEAFSRFVQGVEAASLQAEMRESPVDFVAAPFVPVWPSEDVCVQRREGLERVYIHGKSYHRQAESSRRLRCQGDGSWQAVVEIAGLVWAKVAVFNEGGQLIEGPLALPEVNSPWVGQPLQEGLRQLLARALPPRAPQLLQPSLQEVLLHTPLLWGNTKTDWAQIKGEALVLHAAFAERMQTLEVSVGLEAIARAVEPVAQRLAQSLLLARTTD